jgi:aminoglycoside 6-adenylyltransferase
MRTEQEMLDLIVGTAREDERIRAVILNGSRANPGAARDFFQDFDVVYVVTDAPPFRHNYDWIRRFGELMILQEPDDMRDAPAAEDERFAYLMQFMDGNRIDLTIHPLGAVDLLRSDSLSRLLLDKDNIIPPFPPASEADYLPRPPTAKAFADCCNEFWWCCPYVAKGLWREQIIYAKSIFEEAIRPQLMKMLAWYVGVRTGFAKNAGAFGKHLERYLEPELSRLLMATYADAGYEATWESLFAACDLFRRAAVAVAEHGGLTYPSEDDKRVTAHLRHVRTLPKDASDMYA